MPFDSAFPANLDTFPADGANLEKPVVRLENAVRALEAKVGKNASTDTTSIDSILAGKQATIPPNTYAGLPVVASDNVQHVSTLGNDSNTGNSWGAGYAKLTVQAAVNALPASGGKVMIAGGTYNLSTAIVGKHDIVLQGMGISTTQLIVTGTGVSALTALNSNYIELRDLYIQGPGATSTATGVQFTNCNHTVIHRCYITSFNVNVEYLPGTNSSFDCEISGSRIISANTINIRAMSGTNQFVLANTTFGGSPAQKGLYYYDSSALTVLGGDAEGVSQAVIEIDAPAQRRVGATITSVYIEATTSTLGDIRIGSTAAILGVTISGCFFNTSGAGGAVNAQRVTGLTVVGCANSNVDLVRGPTVNGLVVLGNNGFADVLAESSVTNLVSDLAGKQATISAGTYASVPTAGTAATAIVERSTLHWDNVGVSSVPSLNVGGQSTLNNYFNNANLKLMEDATGVYPKAYILSGNNDATGGFLAMLKARTSLAAPTVCQSGDLLGTIVFEGYTTVLGGSGAAAGANFQHVAEMRGLATETYGATWGGKIQLRAVPPGGTAVVLHATIGGDEAIEASSGGLLARGTGTVSTGPGCRMIYNTGATAGQLQAFNWTSGVWSDWLIQGLNIKLQPSGGAGTQLVVNSTGTGINGNTPVPKAAAILTPLSDSIGTKAAIDAIRLALTNLGVTA